MARQRQVDLRKMRLSPVLQRNAQLFKPFDYNISAQDLRFFFQDPPLQGCCCGLRRNDRAGRRDARTGYL